MHHGLRSAIVSFGCCCLIAPAWATLPQQTVSSGADTVAALSSPHAGMPKMCFDELYYRAMPGKVNYCLGLRSWSHGNYDDGLELLKLAAGWGNKNAQYTLGLIYYNGHHVQVNRALGIAWLELANERDNDARIALVANSVLKWATLAERKRANGLYQQMVTTYGDKVAAARAWRHLQHWKMGHGPFNTGCAMLYGQQAWVVSSAGLTMPISVKTSSRPGAEPSTLICLPVQVQRHLVRRSADTYFQGWAGTVSVGPLETVPVPAASSGH